MGNLVNRQAVFLRILRTRLKYSPAVNELFGMGLTLVGILYLPFNRTKAAGSLMRAHRNSRNMRTQKFLEFLLTRFNLYNPDILDRLVEERYVESPLVPSRCLKLKEKLDDEKGVIIMKFNDTFTALRRVVDMDSLLADYTLCLELSYYGCCNPQILQFMRYRDHHVVVGAVQELERAYLHRLTGNLVRADYNSSTWVDERLFTPMSLPKEYDCIVVAMWDDIKRHYLLFEAIAELNDPTYRACVVGFTLHEPRERIDELIDYYGIRQNVIIFERQKQPQVNILLNKSKVNLLLSFKEGGNKSIIEGFFADVPGIVLSEHIGIDLDWINDQTGRLVDKRRLAESLQWFRTDYARFHPRKWALEHISCAASTAKLESTLREIAKREGRPWTRPLAVKINVPECDYYDPAGQLAPLDLSRYRRPAITGHSPVA